MSSVVFGVGCQNGISGVVEKSHVATSAAQTAARAVHRPDRTQAGFAQTTSGRKVKISLFRLWHVFGGFQVRAHVGGCGSNDAPLFKYHRIRGLVRLNSSRTKPTSPSHSSSLTDGNDLCRELCISLDRPKLS